MRLGVHKLVCTKKSKLTSEPKIVTIPTVLSRCVTNASLQVCHIHRTPRMFRNSPSLNSKGSKRLARVPAATCAFSGYRKLRRVSVLPSGRLRRWRMNGTTVTF